jgi:FkbM family methyltransferase
MTNKLHFPRMRGKLKRAVAAALSSHPELEGWVRRVYCALGLGTRTDQDFLFAFARKHRDVFVLQVGANDGLIGDPIHRFVMKYRWKGLLLEPMPDFFASLQKNYQDREGLILYNGAMSDRDGTMTFYRVSAGEALPYWCNRLCSFSLDAILCHKPTFPDIEKYVIEQIVQTATFNTLVERFGISRIDLVVIDAEGYDYEILKQIDLQRFRPGLVIYEHNHLEDSAKEASIKLLDKAGYDVHKASNMNLAAVRRR